MSGWMIAARACLALGACVGLAIKGNYPMSLVLFAYALADCGLLWATWY